MSQSKNSRSRNWLFTDFKYLDPKYWEEMYKTNDRIRFVMGGLETCPSTGKRHVQGWIQFEKPQRFTAVKKILVKANFQACRGTEEQNIEYCSKEGNAFQFGEYKVQGQQTSLKDAYLMLKNGCEMTEIAEKYNHLYLRFHSAFDKLAKMYQKKKGKENLVKWAQSKKLRTWQKEAVQELHNQSDREVLWVVDKEGDKGKSFLARYLVGTENAFYVRNGKSGDIAYSYAYEETVVFDFTRSQEERINYSIIEAFKDGMLFSPKYESQTKIFKPTKVIVFSNFMPNKSELSEDRWNILEL